MISLRGGDFSFWLKYGNYSYEIYPSDIKEMKARNMIKEDPLALIFR